MPTSLIRGTRYATLAAGGRRRRTAATVDSPDDIAGLTLWLKSTGFTGLNDGDAISTWSDASGLGNDVTGAGGARPLYKTNIVNGIAVARFDGSDDVMAVPSLAARTVFIVMAVAPAGNSLVDGVWGRSGNDTENIRRDVGTGGWLGQSGDTTTDANDFAFAGEFRVNGVRTALVGEGVWHYLSAERGSAAATFQWTLGGQTANARFLRCDVAEVIVYNVVLTTVQRQAIEAYIAAKYAI